ncbi:hypothetical protein MHL_3546 [Mesomycoplasma hyopneumoniae 7422]|nr:hypothetical protein MHL_3546 [Mesomycoplasma hyopneumoniae 7422]
MSFWFFLVASKFKRSELICVFDHLSKSFLYLSILAFLNFNLDFSIFLINSRLKLLISLDSVLPKLGFNNSFNSNWLSKSSIFGELLNCLAKGSLISILLLKFEAYQYFLVLKFIRKE